MDAPAAKPLAAEAKRPAETLAEGLPAEAASAEMADSDEAAGDLAEEQGARSADAKESSPEREENRQKLERSLKAQLKQKARAAREEAELEAYTRAVERERARRAQAGKKNDNTARDAVRKRSEGPGAPAPADESEKAEAEADVDSFAGGAPAGGAPADGAPAPADDAPAADAAPAAPPRPAGRATRADSLGSARATAAWRLDSPNGHRIYQLLADSRIVYEDVERPEGFARLKKVAKELETSGGAVSVIAIPTVAVSGASRVAAPQEDFRVAEELLAIATLEVDDPIDTRSAQRKARPAAEPEAKDAAKGAAGAPGRLAKAQAVLRTLGEPVGSIDTLARLRDRVRLLRAEHLRSMLKMRAPAEDLEGDMDDAAELRGR
jgi:hypothetical protein